jgi:hypothetical protein
MRFLRVLGASALRSSLPFKESRQAFSDAAEYVRHMMSQMATATES